MFEQKKQELRFEGVVKEIGNVEPHMSKIPGALPYETRKIKVETTDEKYPQSAYFTVRDPKWLNFPFYIGTRVEVFYNFRAYTTQFGTCGTALNAWHFNALPNNNNEEEK